MENEYYKKKLNGAKKLYFNIGAISCPALNNKIVYFDRSGFRHLLRKGKKHRDVKDQLRRFHLLSYATSIIKKGEQIMDKKIDTSRVPEAYFYRIGLAIEGKMIKVIVRQIGPGKLHFFSIMD